MIVEKICGRCNRPKAIEEFGPHSGRKDGKQSFCKVCANAVSLDWYKKNKHRPDVKHRLYKNAKEKVIEIKQELDEIKQRVGCLVCGEKDACCLDFHHKQEELKGAAISAIRSTKNKVRLAEELKKCVVLCSNCHRKLHAKRFSLIPG